MNRPARRSALWSFAPAFALAFAAACGGQKREDCDAMVSLVNQSLEELEHSRQQQKNDPTKTVELRKMSELVDASSKKASELAVSTVEVRGLSQRYAAMTKEIARTANEVAAAHEKNDLAALEKARGQLNDVLKLEDPIVDELNKFCSQ